MLGTSEYLSVWQNYWTYSAEFLVRITAFESADWLSTVDSNEVHLVELLLSFVISFFSDRLEFLLLLDLDQLVLRCI